MLVILTVLMVVLAGQLEMLAVVLEMQLLLLSKSCPRLTTLSKQS